MIIYKTPAEIEIMREAAQIVSRTLGKIAEVIEPGINTLMLDELAEDYIRSQNATPGFKGMYGFHYTLCISINEQVVHGMPSKRILQEGDIISVDCGAVFEGFYGDHAYTFEVGEVNPEVKKLLEDVKETILRFPNSNTVAMMQRGPEGLLVINKSTDRFDVPALDLTLTDLEGCYNELRNNFTIAIERKNDKKFVTRWGTWNRGGMEIQARDALYFIRVPFEQCRGN
jgi:hypothetical protein